MCDLADGLALCTCDGEALSDPDWILERRDATRPEEHKRGRALVPRYSDDEQRCLDAVVAALDEGACFDFDYAPREGDVLILRDAGKGKRYRFRYEGGWAVDTSTSLTGWRAQMVRALAGRRA